MESPTQGSNIADTIFRDLRRQILSGEIAAGRRLPGERELASRYGTNRNTLREAVRKLEQSRLVTVRHGQGVTVADFRKNGTMELLGPLLETAPDLHEVVHILEDILPARAQVLELATRVAVRRADKADIERIEGITDLLVSAFDTKDPTVVSRGFHRWLEALLDAGHSTAIRWVANPFLDTYAEILQRYPGLWVLEPSFPEYLRESLAAMKDGDEERAVLASRSYYEKVDQDFVVAMRSAIGSAQPQPTEAPAAAKSSDEASEVQGDLEDPTPGSPPAEP